MRPDAASTPAAQGDRTCSAPPPRPTRRTPPTPPRFPALVSPTSCPVSARSTGVLRRSVEASSATSASPSTSSSSARSTRPGDPAAPRRRASLDTRSSYPRAPPRFPLPPPRPARLPRRSHRLAPRGRPRLLHPPPPPEHPPAGRDSRSCPLPQRLVMLHRLSPTFPCLPHPCLASAPPDRNASCPSWTSRFPNPSPSLLPTSY